MAAQDETVHHKFEKGGDRDVSEGPLKNRRCTDVLCIFLFLAHLAAYGFVTVLGVQDGNPEKLFRPRDYNGGYCGIDASEDGGLDLTTHEKARFNMNVSASVEVVARQLLCSTAAETEIRNAWGPGAALDEYLCACCKSPCGTCLGSLDTADLADGAAVNSIISGRMLELTGGGGDLFSSSSLNGDLFSNVWSQATQFFVPACSTTCGALTADPNRTYTYEPYPDDPLAAAWMVLKTGTGVDQQIKATMAESFSFAALPASVCPYDARYCVPMPGVSMTEMPGGQCMLEPSADVVNALGSAAADAYKSLGVENIASSAAETLGSWSGDFLDTLDSFALVAVSAFVAGFIFLVLLRFFVGCMVWLAIFAVFFIFLGGGALCWVRHTQCAGVGFWESGEQIATGAATAASHAAQNAVSGNSLISGEELSGNGADYRGVQDHTRSGKTCQAWNDQTPHGHTFTPANFPDAGLDGNNYCRNPTGEAATIWCFTTDSEKSWELCSPIGALQAECPQGYDVQSKEMRKVLEILAFVIWGFAALWVLCVCCLCRQIRLAIKLNKVAAVFVTQTPSVLLVPIGQSLVGIIWCLAWAASAAFLLSQVPEGHVPSSFYSTYAEAYGTEDTAGKCTGPFVNGHVWKYAGNPLVDNDPCSGNMGNTTGITPACWGCYAPRYVIDWRFAVSFFSFLWNNAFLVALGQLIIAGACSVWFFTPREQKGQRSAVRTGVWISFRYHLGSVAFGSLIIAIVQFVRYTLQYFEKQAGAAKNRIMVIVLKVTQCCLWCFEKCLKFLNKNAYIQIALLGKPFCTSAKAAFFLIFRNLARFGAVAVLGSIIYYIGILFITAGTTVAGYFLLKALHPEVTPVLPMAVYVILSYLVSKLFMNVYGLSVDTMLQCFIATEEMGGDSGFVPSQLSGLMAVKGEA